VTRTGSSFDIELAQLTETTTEEREKAKALYLSSRTPIRLDIETMIESKRVSEMAEVMSDNYVNPNLRQAHRTFWDAIGNDLCPRVAGTMAVFDANNH